MPSEMKRLKQLEEENKRVNIIKAKRKSGEMNRVSADQARSLKSAAVQIELI